MYQQLNAFLAPLREIDWSSWPCDPAGLLQRPISFDRRYGTVPPEAVPIINLGVDGCHYAVWLDDPRALVEDPGVVLVSPVDSYPDQLRWVAPSVQSFRRLLRDDDDWLLRDEPAIERERQRAIQRRADQVTVMTADGIGVVERDARASSEMLDNPDDIKRAICELLAGGAPQEALVVARNAIASGASFPGLGTAVAEVYRALDRPEYAEVALRSYEPSEAQLALHARIAAMMRERLGPSN